jgi:hypothetical protein
VSTGLFVSSGAHVPAWYVGSVACSWSCEPMGMSSSTRLARREGRLMPRACCDVPYGRQHSVWAKVCVSTGAQVPD